MNLDIPGWRVKQYDDGREVLLKTVKLNGLEQSFAYAYRITEMLSVTVAAKDFSVAANPTALFIVLHAYSKGTLPEGYNDLARHIDNMLSQ